MQKKLKIIHFHPDKRMADIFVMPLIETEKRIGYISYLCVSRSYKPYKYTIPFELSLKQLIIFPIIFFKIFKIIYSLKPDVVISHNTRSSLLPLLISFLMGVKYRIYFNHGVPFIAYTGILYFILKNLERVNLYLSNKVITVSSDMVNFLKELSINKNIHPELLGAGSACGVDLNRFKYISHQKKNDKSWLFVGRPEIRKGFKVVLDLWSQFFTDSDFNLILCGPNKSDVIKFLPYVPNNIKCLGFVTNIENVYLESKGLLLPSFHEGFSYAVLEAMLSGTIVIANNIPGIRNIIVDKKNGFLINDNDLSAYAELICSIENNVKLSSFIVERAILDSIKFDRKLILDAYGNFLFKLENSLI